MPFVIQTHNVTIMAEGTYSITSDLGLPVTSENPEENIISSGSMLFRIVDIPSGFVTVENTPVLKYPRFASLEFFSGSDAFIDAVNLEYRYQHYKAGQNVPFLTTEENGVINYRTIQVRLNYQPCLILISFRKFVFVPD